MRIELHIEEVVLDGLPLGRGEQPRLQAALVQELTRLLGDATPPPPLTSAGTRDVVHGTPLRVNARPDAAPLGTQIAASIHAGLGGRR